MNSLEYINQWNAKKLNQKQGIDSALKNIKQKKHKHTNQFADDIHHKIFKNLDCLDCANCCKSIPPILNSNDVNAIAKHLELSTSDFKSNYVLVDEDGDTVFNVSPCRFLNPDNRCQIYAVRPRACREYPHTDHQQFLQNFKLHKQNALYCPAVFHLIHELEIKISKPS